MEKKKSRFDVVTMTQIPSSFLTKGTLLALKGREEFIDTDETLSERIYSGSIFEAILCENEQLEDSPIAITDAETLKQIEELAEEIGTDYIQITEI